MSKQGGTLKLVNPKHEDWASIQLLTLQVLNFLFTLPRCQVIFQWKQTKEKLKNALSASMNFRVDFTWRMGNISQFPRGFCKNCQGHTFCSGYFRERAHGKIHPRKVDKNNRDTTFFFSRQQQNKVYCLFFNTQQKFPPNTCQNKCIYKHSVNPKYIKQWITYHFKTYIWLGTFRYNCTQGQLYNEGEGELHETNQSREKTKVGAEIIW